MYSFHEFIHDTFLFVKKSQDLKILFEIEKNIIPLNKDDIDSIASNLINIMKKQKYCQYVLASSILKCCFIRPFEIEAYLELVHKIKEKDESFFKVFKQIINLKIKEKTKRNDIIFIWNKLTEMNDLKATDLLHIKSECYPHFIHYFDNQQLRNSKYTEKEYGADISEMKGNDWFIHKKLLYQGLHPNLHARCIELDNVQDFIVFSNNPDFTIDGIIPDSIYDRISILETDISYIEYAALCGSAKCFNYLLINGAKPSTRLAKFAIYGGNHEILVLCDHNHISLQNSAQYALQYHRFDICNWLLEKKDDSLPQVLNILNLCLESVSFNMLIEYLPRLKNLKEFLKNVIEDGNNLLLSFLVQFKEMQISYFRDMITKSCEIGSFDLFQLFHSQLSKTKYNKKGYHLLHKAAFSENDEIVQVLVNRKELNINEKNSNGETSFHIACQNSSREIARILLNHSCNINSQVDISGVTGLHLACENGNAGIVDIIVDHKDLMIDIKDNLKYETALHVACRRGFRQIAEVLIRKGFYINEVAKCFMTPLHFSCKYGNLEVVDYLLSDENIKFININTKTSSFILFIRFKF